MRISQKLIYGGLFSLMVAVLFMGCDEKKGTTGSLKGQGGGERNSSKAVEKSAQATWNQTGKVQGGP
ncbi:MAG: hypothetical protein N2112_04080 [Gemmataceae bacterium]|jgi:hypothetical protein|nr:hypothetical protein [Gemmataceae bacterium]